MAYRMWNDNFAVGNAGTALLAMDSEVKGSEHMDDDLESFVAEAARVKYKYELGDMVWAKVKFYPWRPGQIYNEAWASPSIFKTKKEGHVLVAFFGDNKYRWFDPKKLIPLDYHYVEKSNQTRTSAFLNAVEEAENEVSRRAALGLPCPCHNLLNFRSINLFDWFYAVDIKGYEPSGVYSMKQIRSARDGFQPVVTVSFVRLLALMPGRKFQQDVDWIKNSAMDCTNRNAVFGESDETHAVESGAQSKHLSFDDAGHFVDVTQNDSKHPGEYPSSKKVIKVDSKKRKKEAERQCSMTHVFQNLKDGRNES